MLAKLTRLGRRLLWPLVKRALKEHARKSPYGILILLRIAFDSSYKTTYVEQGWSAFVSELFKPPCTHPNAYVSTDSEALFLKYKSPLDRKICPDCGWSELAEHDWN